MSRSTNLPPILFLRSLWLRLRGRVHFPRDSVGDIVHGENEDFRVFRRIVVDPHHGQVDPPGAILEVEFHFKRFSPAVNRHLSRIPMPFIAVQPGFHSKTWMVGQDTGAFRGVYEWATTADAERYLDSFPMRMMRRRAAPGTLTTSIRSTRSTGDRVTTGDGLGPDRGALVRVSRQLSNLAAGHLRDPGFERREYPSWEIGDGEVFMLSNVRVVDVDRGCLADAEHVVVRGDRIVELVASGDLGSVRDRLRGVREIDGGGRFLIPGLSDIHCHVSLVTEFGVGVRQLRHLDDQRLRNVEAALEQGCTFVRDCGGAVEPLGFLRSEIEARRLVGPRIITSLNAVSPKGGMWDVGPVMSKLAEPMFGGRYMRFPDGVDELVAAMGEINDAGCDFFKTYFEERPLYGGKEDDVFATFTPAEATAIRDIADRFGRPVSAHAMFISGARRALEAGVDVLDHCTVDEPYGEEDAQRMAEQGTAIVPTLSIGTFLAMDCGPHGYPNDPEVGFFAEQRNKTGRRNAQHVAIPELISNYERFFDWLYERQDERKMPMIGPVWPRRVHGFAHHAPTSMERLRAAGVRVGVGTDGGTGVTFCGHLETELAALRRYGYSNAEVLRMATLGNMEIVGWADRLGSLDVGKLADMVLLRANPLDSVEAIGTVDAVFKGGRLCSGSL